MEPKPGIFLTAEWRHLVVLNFEVDPQLLTPYVPPGLEIDLWHGKTYVSLVAFLFRRTRVCGLAIPFHCNFPEVNLRFYVTRQMPDGLRRGVVFLREVAPRRAVAYVARRFYGEKYLALPMRESIELDGRFNEFACRSRFEWRLGDQAYAIEATSNAMPRYPDEESLDEFIIEHYWGYSAGLCREGSCVEYEVEHRRWLIRPAASAEFAGDATPLYGREFAEVLSRPPDSAFLADGSAVAVRRGTPVTSVRVSFPPAARELAANAGK